jgi:hypothetical protein
MGEWVEVKAINHNPGKPDEGKDGEIGEER